MDLLWFLSSSVLSVAAGWLLYDYFVARSSLCQTEENQLEEAKCRLIISEDDRFPPHQ